MALTGLTMNGGAAPGAEIAADLSFVPACAAGCLFMIAVCLRFAAGPSRSLGYLAANAYGLYLVHYVFIVWLQFALLALRLVAVIKAPLVFGGTLFLSFATTLAAYLGALASSARRRARLRHLSRVERLPSCCRGPL
jgi:glucans biosynthesis protein C